MEVVFYADYYYDDDYEDGVDDIADNDDYVINDDY